MEESIALEWTPELVREFWQHYAKNRQEDYFTNLFGDRIMEITSRYYAADAAICDYGCGSGFLLEHILKSHRAAGFDFTPQNIDATRKRIGHMPNLIDLFSVGDAKKVGPQFDVLYVVETVEHVLEPDLDLFFASLGELLKPRGTIIVTTPCNEDLQANTVFCPCCNHTFHRWQHVRTFDEVSISAFMSRGGFISEKAFATDFSAKTPWRKFKSWLRPLFRRPNPHLVYVGRKPA